MQCLILWLFWFPGWWTILDTFGIGSKPQSNHLLDDGQNINWMGTYKIVFLPEHFSTLAAEIYHSCQSLVERSIFTPPMNCFRARKCLHRCSLLLAQTWWANITVSSTTLPYHVAENCCPLRWFSVRLNNRPVVGTSTLTWTFSLFGLTTMYCLNCLCAKTQIICLFFMSWQRWCYLSFIPDWWKRRRWFLLRLKCTTTTLLSISNWMHLQSILPRKTVFNRTLLLLTTSNRFKTAQYDGSKRVGLKKQKLTNGLGLSKFYCLWVYFCHKICFKP